MSPEQCLGQKLDARSDIYSMGCVIHEMLTGRPPLKGDGSLQTLLKHIEGEADIEQTLPREAERLILRATEKDVSKRYQSMAELTADLGKAASSMANEAPSAHGKQRKRQAKSKSRWSKSERVVAWFLIPLCAAIAAAGLATVLNSYFFQPEWRKTLDKAQACVLQHRFYEAKDLLQQALQLAKKNGEPAAEQAVHQALGEFYLADAQIHNDKPGGDLARDELQAAFKIADAKGTPFEKAHLLDNLGEVTHFSEHYSDSEDYYTKAVSFRKHDPGPQNLWLAGTVMRQAINYVSEKKYDLAKKSYLEAAELLERGGEKTYIIDCYKALAELEFSTQDYEPASVHFDKCIKIIESTADKSRLAEVTAEKARALKMLHKTD